jgi:hypothetical protein
VGILVGLSDGDAEDKTLGSLLGVPLGLKVGNNVGASVELLLGFFVGDLSASPWENQSGQR